jgi:hypothetical protein
MKEGAARDRRVCGGLARLPVYDSLQVLHMRRELHRLAPTLRRRDQQLVAQLQRATKEMVFYLHRARSRRGVPRSGDLERALDASEELRRCLALADAWGYLRARGNTASEAVDRTRKLLERLRRMSA